MAQERNNGGGGRTAATAGIIALLLLLGGGGYFGLGPGQGMLPGNGDSAAQEQSEGQGGAQEAAVQTEQDEKEEAVSGIPDNIVVTIKKDAVTTPSKRRSRSWTHITGSRQYSTSWISS